MCHWSRQVYRSAKWHLTPSNGLSRVHECNRRQTDRQTDRPRYKQMCCYHWRQSFLCWDMQWRILPSLYATSPSPFPSFPSPYKIALSPMKIQLDALGDRRKLLHSTVFSDLAAPPQDLSCGPLPSAGPDLAGGRPGAQPNYGSISVTGASPGAHKTGSSRP